MDLTASTASAAREQTTKREHTATKRTRPAKIESDTEQKEAKRASIVGTNNNKKRKRAKRLPNWLENGGGAQQQAEMSSLFRPPKNLKLTVKNGIRNLQPYWGILCGYTKRRWVGKTVGEVYATEFSTLLHPLYAKAACRKGRIFINNRAILSPDHRLRDNEFFMHINHRHENEIPDLPIQILAETDDLLVLNKPAGLPVHPYKRLTCLYRLDRTTTGVLMFAKNEQFDSEFKKNMRTRKMLKEYVCKVEGKFPDEEMICDARIGVLCHSMGIRCVRPDGQEAFSKFSLLRYLPAENTSLVNCIIETGRTHQIRIHLQFLGHPIVGDQLYNDNIWGPEKGKSANYGERTLEQLAADVSKAHSKDRWILEQDPDYEQRLRQTGEDEFCEVEEFDLTNFGASLEKMPSWDPLCWHCSVLSKRELQKSDWLMALHCRRYSGEGWSYEAPLPDWALPHDELVVVGKEQNEQRANTASDGEGNGAVMASNA
uniref:Pseudouridine synthase RsuA/RluA-like domain-containing protein n=1 Tax=Globodera rostochiensis TaxID=31243 RepID=A0A914I3W4_GLORO